MVNEQLSRILKRNIDEFISTGNKIDCYLVAEEIISNKELDLKDICRFDSDKGKYVMLVHDEYLNLIQRYKLFDPTKQGNSMNFYNNAYMYLMSENMIHNMPNEKTFLQRGIDLVVLSHACNFFNKIEEELFKHYIPDKTLPIITGRKVSQLSGWTV